MKYQPNTSNYHYDYKNKCDCSEDDKCGCDFPNNMPHNFTQDYNEKTSTYPKIAILGKQAPNFIAPAILGDNTIVQHFNLYKYVKNYNAILFFYPEDFSFSCPSELLMLNQEINAFTKRDTKIIAISTDELGSHIAWKNMPPQKDGISDIIFPLIADFTKSISKSYQVLTTKETPLRATFILDKQQIIRHVSLNDNAIWRNPTELFRIIDIINNFKNNSTNCPKNWKQNFPFERPTRKSIYQTYSPPID